MERKHTIPKTSSPKLTKFGPILNEITITENNIPMASDRIFSAEKLQIKRSGGCDVIFSYVKCRIKSSIMLILTQTVKLSLTRKLLIISSLTKLHQRIGKLLLLIFTAQCYPITTQQQSKNLDPDILQHNWQHLQDQLKLYLHQKKFIIHNNPFALKQWKFFQKTKIFN